MSYVKYNENYKKTDHKIIMIIMAIIKLPRKRNDNNKGILYDSNNGSGNKCHEKFIRILANITKIRQ